MAGQAAGERKRGVEQAGPRDIRHFKLCSSGAINRCWAFSLMQGADLLAARTLPWDIRFGLAGFAGWLAQIAGCGRILAQSVVELQLHPTQAGSGL